MQTNNGLETSPPAIVHVPHASIVIPEDIRAQFLLSDAELQTELLRMTDWYTDELFDVVPARATKVTFPVSRLVLDPERFEDDRVEMMASRGMGVIYERTSGGLGLRAGLDHEQRASLLERFYRPHHRRLEQAVDKCLAAWGWCLIVDAHSFPSVPLPYELDQNRDRPAICIGTDLDHTPGCLAEVVEEYANERSWSVRRNSPFGGALVPAKHYRNNQQAVWSIMIEVRRDLYMDELSGAKLPEFGRVQQAILDLCDRLMNHAKHYAATGSDLKHL